MASGKPPLLQIPEIKLKYKPLQVRALEGSQKALGHS